MLYPAGGLISEANKNWYSECSNNQNKNTDIPQVELI